LTLRFLGETPDATLELVSAGLEAAASVCPPLSGALGGLRLLPSPRRPRVLVVEVALPQAGYTLQAACEDAARRAGLEGEPRAFRPHVTLARVRKPVKVLTLPDLSFGSTLLEELTLFQSHLGRGGSVYTPIRSFPLGGA
jgi:2'-5' RNA ligase